MEAVIELYGGGQYRLPPLLSWEVTLTGGVPCDSFSLSCAYEAAMAEKLEKVWRVTMEKDGTLLYGVVDEVEIVQDGKGRALEISGRGLAALLLDNECQAMEYTRPTLSELLKNHAGPYGFSWDYTELRGGTYSVSSGSSQWKALSGFTRYVGGFVPRFSPEGRLLAKPWKDDGVRYAVNARTPILKLAWKEKRYGVYSEVLVVDKTRKTRQSVKNEAFLARGGCCRRVVYTPGKSTAVAMRYTGDYQIAQSKQGKRCLTLVLPGFIDCKPGSVVRMERGDIGITGDFYVEEMTTACNGQGERTMLEMRRLTE